MASNYNKFKKNDKKRKRNGEMETLLFFLASLKVLW